MPDTTPRPNSGRSPGHVCLATLGHYIDLGVDAAGRITREDDPADRRC